MFESLSSSLQRVFKKLRGYGKLSEGNIKDAMREVRIALLEADVHYQVVKQFTTRVRERCLGREVLESITPGQQVIKHVHEELVHLLGGAHSGPDLSGRPALVMLLGLHGSGKTTTAAKLAAMWKKQERNVLLVAADIRRPAAVEQLSTLAAQVGTDIVVPAPNETVPELGTRALALARESAADITIVDTGGRFQIDNELVAELQALQAALHARNVVLVADAATGQEAVNVAEAFHNALGLTGLILTKLDGDARGGAALSMHTVTHCPILYVGVGEKPADLEAFHPERMASRILGMGDIVGLVEKAQESVDLEQMATLEKRLRAQTFDLQDFLGQLRQMKRMLPFESLREMLPTGMAMPGAGAAGMPTGDEMRGFAKRAEAIICSMTRKERRYPRLLNASRRRRIAAGSGTKVSEVNELVRRFGQARKMMKRFGRLQKGLLKSNR